MQCLVGFPGCLRWIVGCLNVYEFFLTLLFHELCCAVLRSITSQKSLFFSHDLFLWTLFGLMRTYYMCMHLDPDPVF